MKIAYVINSFANGGAELGLVTLAENGFFSGHDVKVFALVQERGIVRERLANALGNERVNSLSPAPVLRTRYLLPAAFKLARVLREEQPDVVILSLPQDDLIGRIVSFAAPDARIVGFLHNPTYNRGFVKYLMRATAWLDDAVFYDHEELWEALRPMFLQRGRCAAHYVPLTVLSPRAPPSKPPGGRTHLLTAGRLVEQKNFAELLHAIRATVDEGRDVSLTIAGEGPRRSALENQIRDLHLEDRVHLAGFVADMDRLRAEAHIYIQSSIYEGLCLSVLEAMADGMIIVATDVGGMRSYGVDGGNMIKVDAPDRRSLAEGIARAMSLGPATPHVWRSAMETIERNFSLSVVQEHWRAALAAVGPEGSLRPSSSGEHARLFAKED